MHVVKFLNDIEYYYSHFSNVDLIEEHVDELYVMLNRNVFLMMEMNHYHHHLLFRLRKNKKDNKVREEEVFMLIQWLS